MSFLTNFAGLVTTRHDKPLQYHLPESIETIPIIYDTEYTIKDKLVVDSVQFYAPTIAPNHCLVFFNDELNNLSSPLCILEHLGIKAKSLDDNDLSNMYDFTLLHDELTSNCTELKTARKIFKSSLNNGLYDKLLNQFSLNREQLEFKKISQNESEIVINVDKLKIDLIGFFNDVDLFKIFGIEHQKCLLNAKLEARRVIKSTARYSDICLGYYWLDGKIFEVFINLKDVMNRFPVLSGNGLDNQCKTYQADTQKINIETEELRLKLGLSSIIDIKKNMSTFRLLEPELFSLYGSMDCLATWKLHLKQQELLDVTRDDFNLPLVEIKDTTGSNVGKFIEDLYNLHFNPNCDKKSDEIIKSQKHLGSADRLQNSTLNYFGIQSMRTVGGLLYSRVQRYPYIRGILGDLDMSSCYATKLCELTIYLGEPIISCFKGKFKPTLREVLETIKQVKCPNDGWFVRVSGKLINAVNTLILSDLKFTGKDEKFNTIWDKNKNEKSINEWNVYKIGKQEASSTLLTKEIKFGLINIDILDCLKLLPNDWYDEFLELYVDTFVFIPNELICHSLDELIAKKPFYPESDCLEKYDKSTGLTGLDKVYSQNNLCLAFPIGDYYKKLKDKRSQYKKDGNPIQEVYKLFLNSGYGALACKHLAVNNLLAANQITASPRATAWLMSNALNAFQTITDGCTFNWNTIPYSQTFKNILADNPNYLIDYNPHIDSGLEIDNDNCQDWITHNFKQHLRDFYQSNCTPINRFDFELKDEKFSDNLGNVIKTYIYTDFINSGSGNYSKGLNGSNVLIDGTDYNFSDSFKKVKARSFKGENPELLDWYINSLRDEYREPITYSENKIIKFGEAKELAVRLLQELDSVAFPCGFSKVSYKLMKLITRSQFLFKSESQLRNFETNQLKLDCLSKNILTRTFWKNINDNLEHLKPYGIDTLKYDWEDYYNFAKDKPVGLGFELLALNSIHKGSIESVRNLISDEIEKNKNGGFNAILHLDRSFTLASKYRWLFAAIIIKKCEADKELISVLVNSNDPTIFKVSKEDVTTLGDLIGHD